MTGTFFSHCKRLLLGLLILFSFSRTLLFSQSDTIINNYAKVLTRSDYQVTVDNASGFSAGNYALIIQMKGVSIYNDSTSIYGNIASIVGIPGQYEFLIINSVIGNTITFLSKIKKYDPAGFVQIVRVPFFNSAGFNNILKCKPWDPVAGTGGILAMIVGRTLTLKGDIDVSGKGFKGGIADLGLGVCAFPSSITNIYSFPASFQDAGYKGEGNASHYTPYTGATPVALPQSLKGQGALFSGGGGGNGRFSGGGGGSNRGAGWFGFYEDNYCYPSQNQGGTGGYGMDARIDTVTPTSSYPGGVFMGGGGGSSTHLTGAFATPGGNGGGIVFIIADTIKGNNYSIIASGDSATTATNVYSGAGGGGAGGSIMIFSQNYSSSGLNINVNGSKGGDVYNDLSGMGGGTGGGGGGGYLALLKPVSGNVSINIAGGGNNLIKISGFPSDTVSCSGAAGLMRTLVKPVLTGFLFNSISSSVTGDQVDSTCSTIKPPKITGTTPVGGTSPYIYLWQKSYDLSHWIPLVNDSDTTDYTPTLIETSTVYFRRTITDSSAPTTLSDTSKPVKIIVQPAITGNLIGKDTIICYDQNPLRLIQLGTGLSNGSVYHYYDFKWIQNTTNTGWITSPAASGTAADTTYDPPVLTTTTFYERVVTSGRCIDYSLPVKITVLDTIANNKILNSPSDICYGMTFINLSATASPALTGGDNTYRFKWVSNFNDAGWLTAPGVSDTAGYDPVELPQKIPMNEYYYRRIVYSGTHDVCVDTSNTVILKDYPVITNNTITANQTICSGLTPGKLTGSVPQNGDGTYTYSWQDSSKSHPWSVISDSTRSDYQPSALTDTTSYRRIVYSSACSDISNSIIIKVHKPLANLNISLLAGGSDTTICNGETPHILKGTVATGGTDIPGDYTYQWKFSPDDATWSPVTIAGTGVTYQPPSLATTTYYIRQVTSGACTESGNAITVTVLPSITGNIITANQTICYDTVPAPLTGTAPSGGNGTYTFYWEQSADGGSSWTGAAGTNNSSSGSYSPPILTVPMKYRRTVTSGDYGCCTNISNVINITIYPPRPTGTITSTADTTICEGSKVRLEIHLTGSSEWKIIYMENTTKVTIDKIAATDTTLMVVPVTGSAFTTYNYSIFSVEDKNGCFATSLNGTRKADVYKVPTTNAGKDTTVCGTSVILNATPSVGTGTWYYPASVIAITAPNNPEAKVTIDSTLFVNGKISPLFYWEEINWQCMDKDSVLITFDERVNLIDAGNAGRPDTTLYTVDNIIHMDAHLAHVWETGTWSRVSGNGVISNSSDTSAEVTNLSKDNTFLWTVTNGQCENEAMINIAVDPVFIPEGFSPNNDQWNNTFVIQGVDPTNQIDEMKVVNGAGTEVFSTSNRDGQTWKEWDGKNSKGIDLPEGTYYYILKITDTNTGANGQVHKWSGFILLKRH